ncbi:MAG: hypothetical protein V4662_11900 [Verrucomicrobiota bacterium]
MPKSQAKPPVTAPAIIGKVWKLRFDFLPLATVTIDEEKAAPFIKQMVEFWMSWEDNLEEAGGDYTRAWLKMLGLFIVNNGKPPRNDEGWCDLDGSFGITLNDWDRYEPDESGLEIIEA